MPDNVNELLWWAFNAAFFGLAYFMKRDLSEIKTDTKENRKLQEINAVEIAGIKARCDERHHKGVK